MSSSTVTSSDPLLGSIGDIMMHPSDSDDILSQLCADIDDNSVASSESASTCLPASPPWSSEDEEEAMMDLEAAISFQMGQDGSILFRVADQEDKHNGSCSLEVEEESRLALSPPSSLLEGDCEEEEKISVVTPGQIQISIPTLLTTTTENVLNRQSESAPPSICSNSISPTNDPSHILVKTEEDEDIVAVKVEDVASMNHCEVCKLVFTSSLALEVHRMESVRTLCCCQCGKRFVSASKLACHQRKHSKEKPFRCNGCGKHYTHRTTLARHQLHYCQVVRAKCEDSTDLIRPLLDQQLLPNFEEEQQKVVASQRVNNNVAETATPDKSTKCNVCLNDFGSVESLAEHRESYAAQRSCCACGKTLGNRSKLFTHHRSHTKESPFACAFCGKRFAENSTLRKHEATHGARNYQCSDCGRGFVRKDYLAKHALTHRQTYRCSQCKFVCHSRQDMENHVLLH